MADGGSLENCYGQECSSWVRIPRPPLHDLHSALAWRYGPSGGSPAVSGAPRGGASGLNPLLTRKAAQSARETGSAQILGRVLLLPVCDGLMEYGLLFEKSGADVEAMVAGMAGVEQADVGLGEVVRVGVGCRRPVQIWCIALRYGIRLPYRVPYPLPKDYRRGRSIWLCARSGCSCRCRLARFGPLDCCTSLRVAASGANLNGAGAEPLLPRLGLLASAPCSIAIHGYGSKCPASGSTSDQLHPEITRSR